MNRNACLVELLQLPKKRKGVIEKVFVVLVGLHFGSDFLVKGGILQALVFDILFQLVVFVKSGHVARLIELDIVVDGSSATHDFVEREI